jgi:hypothetical protein
MGTQTISQEEKMFAGRKIFGMYGVLVFLPIIFATTSTQLAAAQGAEVAYTFTGDALEGPSSLAAGYHTFTFRNDGDTGVEFRIGQLKGDATVKDVVTAGQNVDAAFENGGDPAAALRTLVSMVDFWGGSFAEPGQTTTVGIPLAKGNYAVIGAYGEETKVDLTMTLEVTEGEATPAPQAEVTVEMVDFAFAIPSDLKAGEQTWQFVNTGKQAHHASIMRIKEGKTMEDVMSFAETFEGEDPTDEVAHIDLLSPGSSNYVTLNLTPGTYVTLCFVPDYAKGGDGAPHMAHGIMQSFTVAEN